MDLLGVTRLDIEHCFIHLNTQDDIDLARKQNLWACSQSFYKFTFDRSKFDETIPRFENPLPEIRKQWRREETKQRSLKDVRLSIAELKQLLQGLKLRNYRDYIAVYILADTGCRIGGLINLKIENIRLEERYFITKEKNSGNNRY